MFQRNRSAVLLWLGALTAAPAVWAQGFITTAAGTEYVFPGNGRPAVEAPLGGARAIAYDLQGNLYVADVFLNLVYRVDTRGILTVVAGNGLRGFSGDGGPAIRASLNAPGGVEVDSAGNVYIADTDNNRIRRVTPAGIISTVAGSGVEGFAGDGGVALDARLNKPRGLAFDSGGNLYIADTDNHRIRVLNSAGVIFTVAGNGQAAFAGDGGPAVAASLITPWGVAVDASGRLHIGDTANHRIRRVESNGTIITIAGNGTAGFSGDRGPARNASLNFPAGLVFDDAGNLYVADWVNHVVRRIAPDQTITTLAGNNRRGFAGDGGLAAEASLDSPFDVAFHPAAGLAIGDDSNRRVRRVRGDGVITTIVGSGVPPAASTGQFLNRPRGVAVRSGVIFIADTNNRAIRRLTTGGAFSTLAETQVPPASAALDLAGNLYFADPVEGRVGGAVYRVTPQGAVTRIAGGVPFPGFTQDGSLAVNSPLANPVGVAVDLQGNIFIADQGDNKIRRVNASDGRIETLTGNGIPGFSPDGTPARAAQVNGPTGLAIDRLGRIFFADRGNRRIRFIDAAGNLQTVAGNGSTQAGPDGPANAPIGVPFGVAVDSQDNVYFSDTQNHLVRRVRDGRMTTIAGNGRPGFSGDGGPGAQASLHTPEGIAVDESATVYIADSANNRIRVVQNFSPSFALQQTALEFTARSGGLASADQAVVVATSTPGIQYSVIVSENWLRVNPPSGSLPAVLRVSADPGTLSPGVYTGRISVTSAVANPPSRDVIVTFTVVQPDPPRLIVDPGTLTFTFVQSGEGTTRQALVVNAGGGSVGFTTSVQTDSGGAWLTVTSEARNVVPGAPVPLVVSARPGTLTPGTYRGRVLVSAQGTNQVAVLNVTMTVSPVQQAILLSQTGFTFTAVAQAGVDPPAQFAVLNRGQGNLAWEARVETLSGGDWVRISPASGVARAGAADVPLSEVWADPRGLAPGVYSARINIVSPLATNSPQAMTVVLNVLPPGSIAGPVVRPTGLVFTATPGGGNPSAQRVVVTNLNSRGTAFDAQVQTFDGRNWFRQLPATGQVNAAGAAEVLVQPDFGSLSEGVRFGALNFLFADGTTRSVSVLSVLSAGTLANEEKDGVRLASCTPSRLLPQFTTLRENFVEPAARPVNLSLRVVDDCGGNLTGGAVVARFSNNDPLVNLNHVGNGVWNGTWLPRNTSLPQVRVVVTALSQPPVRIAGSADRTGTLQTGATTPVVAPGAVLNAASFLADAPVAPGSLISIFGERLSEGRAVAESLPLQTELVGTEVTLGGRALPLLFASDGQVNAQVPYDLNVNTEHHLLVRRGVNLSVPEVITVAPANPAIFTRDQTGRGQGLVFIARPDGTQVLADASNPARAGDVLVIYCSGLGPVTPPVMQGQPAPASPLAVTASPVLIRIGGREATPLFAGLTPGFVGLYQVNVVTPEGVTPGNAVEIDMTVAGQVSARNVTMAVR